MRMPQRNFVVEYKSRSRLTKTSKPPSIWGDRDLKAVARQVDADLFEQPEEKTRTPAILPPAELELSLSDMTAAEFQPIPVDADAQLSDFKETATTQIDSTSTISVASALLQTAEQPPTASEPQDVSKRNARKTTPRARHASHTAPPEGREETAYASRADLAALEEDNMRLKAMLREQLVATNRRLRNMLKRFS